MIFLTVGTQLPFDRLTRAIDAWSAAHPEIEIFGQVGLLGPDTHRPKHFEWAETLSPDLFKAQAQAADVIVSHAGMGSIITALTMKKPLVLMARLASLGEHRNDHQLSTIQRFANRPGLHVAQDETELLALLTQMQAGTDPVRDSIAPFAEPTLIDALKSVIRKRG